LTNQLAPQIAFDFKYILFLILNVTAVSDEIVTAGWVVFQLSLKHVSESNFFYQG